MEKRKYWICYWRDFGNAYNLRWSGDKEQEQYLMEHGYERITYRAAVRNCIDERRARKHDQACSGYGDTHIYPAIWDTEVFWRIEEFDFSTHPYIVFRKVQASRPQGRGSGKT